MRPRARIWLNDKVNPLTIPAFATRASQWRGYQADENGGKSGKKEGRCAAAIAE